MTDDRASFWKRNRWFTWVAGGLLAVLAVAAGVAAVLAHRAEPFLRARIVGELEDHFHAHVELDSLHFSLANGLWAEGKGLRIWPPAQVAGVAVPGPGEPLISLDEFRFRAPLRYQPGLPIHIPVVELEGLHVTLPPKTHFQHPAAGTKSSGGGWVRFDVDRFECKHAHLVLGTDKPGKVPLDFAIAHFRLTNVASDAAMGFNAELTNPRPVGTIRTSGSFGPWQVLDPGETPITGDYRFDRADLSIFKGIAGILNSTGSYKGTLRDLSVVGDADVPDFSLSHFGNTLPLHTHFNAKVDGTNGDTWLEPVDATLGRSHFTAQGQIVRVPLAVPNPGGTPVTGHDIALTVNVRRARIEDFMKLTSHSPAPLLTGDLTLRTKLHVPPGAPPVHERISMAGTFVLDRAQFTSAKIQNRIEELSLRGQGRPGELKTANSAGVQSRMEGSFQLGGGVITLPDLKYTVPGADIRLKGTYGLEDGALSFNGTAKMEATVSQMVGGWKGLLLKPADRLFQKDGAGTEVPIHIEGTREDPKFGIDFEQMKARTKEAR